MKNFMKATGFMALIGTIYMVLSFFAGLIIALIMAIRADGAAFSDPDVFTEALGSATLPIIIVVNALMIGVTFLFFLMRKDKFIPYVGFRRFPLKDGLKLAIFGMSLNLLFIGVLEKINQWFELDAVMNEYAEIMENAFGNANFMVLFLAVVVMAPLWEEIIMRGIVFNDYRKAIPTWAAIVLQAVFFGIIHFNLVQSSYATVLGLILGIIYLYYKSIWAPIIVHVTFNGTSTLLSSFMSEEIMVQYFWLISLIGLVGSLAMTYILVRTYQKSVYEALVPAVETLEAPRESIEVDTISL